MKIKSTEKLVRQTIKMLREGMPEWADEKERDARESADAELQESGIDAIKVLPVDLGQLAAALAVSGMLQVLEGNNCGWQRVDTSILYRYWGLRLHADAYLWSVADGGSTKVSPLLASESCVTAHLLAFSLAMDLHPWQQGLRNLLLEMVPFVAANHPEVWPKRIYEPFVLMLHQKACGGVLPAQITSRSLGPYDGIFANWDAPTRLAGPLTEVCDYHCEKMIDKGLDEEFDIQPFDLYPVEILAIYRVREKLGLETPGIVHPVLSTRLSSLAFRPFSPINDPIIMRVEKLHHDFFSQTHRSVEEDNGSALSAAILARLDDSTRELLEDPIAAKVLTDLYQLSQQSGRDFNSLIEEFVDSLKQEREQES